MKNIEIIALAKEANNIPEEVEVNTLKGWNRLGKKVKAGEHAVFCERIWKPFITKRDEEEEIDGEEVKKVGKTYMRLVKAYFFTEEQVE